MLNVKIQKQLPDYEITTSFTVAKDEIVVLFGPSGSGKTTILNCIAGLSKPSAGQITLHNRVLFDHKHTNVSIQQRNIGYLFQAYALFPHLTVWDNIAYAMKSLAFAERLIKIGRAHV